MTMSRTVDNDGNLVSTSIELFLWDEKLSIFKIKYLRK